MEISSLALWLAWGAAALLGLWVLDRLLLAAEDRGWIYYRRTKPGRGASTYHLLELSAIFDPPIQEVIEVKVQEERQEDESGAPPGPE